MQTPISIPGPDTIQRVPMLVRGDPDDQEGVSYSSGGTFERLARALRRIQQSRRH